MIVVRQNTDNPVIYVDIFNLDQFNSRDSPFQVNLGFLVAVFYSPFISCERRNDCFLNQLLRFGDPRRPARSFDVSVLTSRHACMRALQAKIKRQNHPIIAALFKRNSLKAFETFGFFVGLAFLRAINMVFSKRILN